MLTLASDDVVAMALVQAIRGGDIDALGRLLDEHPELASARLQSGKGTTRTPLHVAADWPGYFPNGPAVVHLLIDAGADPNAPVTGNWHAETPLHWAASSDDADVASALIFRGANIEATGASIAGVPRWTTRSATDAGMWRGFWSSEALGLIGFGMRRRSG
jgi:uncharacterized protein